MKRTVIGQVFTPVNLVDSFQVRLFGSTEDREKWLEKEAKRLPTPTKEKVLGVIGDIFGDEAKDVKISFNRKAGCGCGCSPGWVVSAQFESEFIASSKVGYCLANPTKQRMSFFVGDDGRIDVRTTERLWGRRCNEDSYAQKCFLTVL